MSASIQVWISLGSFRRSRVRTEGSDENSLANNRGYPVSGQCEAQAFESRAEQTEHRSRSRVSHQSRSPPQEGHVEISG